ncbi:MAG TPA: UDP-N-acetylglucosamine 1-carboxyvinyltransferase [Bacillota bacterium]|nr:UDP-N-acetylglucosamine 1-carboxyvinyltransferase [Bacillota bacterium]HQI16841.1 UDP-N-acetylglucosamine 1-carboxyvinyltransferase [Bacillota bacterium]HQJ36511.1 UDP-N-acetylglucosamine 1-carboxyvinyltransferase [Bacillota bacterium]HQL36248.1 UDP-N-acetylglucosamine 1-carboxyvinyltransferase [Bacillota bacterium]
MLTKLIIEDKCALKGEVKVHSAKNAILPVIAASLLTPDTCVLDEVPYLDDVDIMEEVVRSIGAEAERTNSSLAIKAESISSCEATYELVRKMRASFLIMGPMLARIGKVKISLPGGCAIGTRPIDLHLKGFSLMGANITLGHGYIEAYAEKLKGETIYLDFPSVGATENLMMAACLADGTTTIENAAEEPEIVDLASFLSKMGAVIKGAGTDTIRIEGVKELKGTAHTAIPDRIEAGTYMVAAAATGGDVIVEGVVPEHLKPVTAKLKEMGAEVQEYERAIRVRAAGRLNSVDIKTMPYPGFPTDMQSQMMTAMCLAKGTSIATETVFENRFMHINELKLMGANIKVDGRSAIIEGCEKFSGAKVRATDLRAGAALVIAGLCAEGRTEINDVYHLDRGYIRIEEKLKKLGADIRRSEE